MALWNPLFGHFSFKIIHLQNSAYCFSYPFVVFLEWNIYLILKNHIDRKFSNLTTSLAWIFSWMNFTFSTFSTKKNPVSVLIFVCCVWNYTLRLKNTKTENHGNIFASSNLTNTPTSPFFLRKKNIPPPSMTFCVTGTGSIYLGSKPLGLKSVRGKQQGPRHHQICIDLNHQNFWIKTMRFIYHVLTLRQVFRIWRFDKLTKSLKGFNFTKNPRSYQPHFCQEIKTCKQKNLEAPKKS